MGPKIFSQGASLRIEWTDDGEESLKEAELQVPGSRDACKAQLRALIQRLAEIGKLRSGDQFRHEGDQIYAVKTRCGLRAYGWFHGNRRGVFVLSHFIMKKKDKLDPKDLNRAKEIRRLYEERYP